MIEGNKGPRGLLHIEKSRCSQSIDIMILQASNFSPILPGDNDGGNPLERDDPYQSGLRGKHWTCPAFHASKWNKIAMDLNGSL